MNQNGMKAAKIETKQQR